MPTFEFTSPDGKTYQVAGPEGSTQEEAFGHLQSQLGQSQTAAPPSTMVAGAADTQPAVPSMPMTGRFGAVKPTLLQTLQASAPGEILHGFTQGLEGPAQFAANAAGLLNPDAKRFAAAGNEGMAEAERSQQLARKLSETDTIPFWANPGATIGQGIAQAPMAAIAPGGLIGAGLMGAMSPVANAGDNFWGQKGAQTATSGILGKLLSLRAGGNSSVPAAPEYQAVSPEARQINRAFDRQYEGEDSSLGIGTMGQVPPAKPPAGPAPTNPWQPATAEDRGTAYVRDTLNKAGKTVADLEDAAQQTTKPITAAEAIGPQAQTNLMALSRRSGETADAVQAQMGARAADRTDRILGDMAQAAGIHPDAAKGNIEALVQAGQQQAAPLFKQALSAPGPLWNGELADIAKRPAIQKAIGSAAEQLRNQGVNPVPLGLEIDPMMGATGAKEPQPTAQAWDLVRKSINGQLERNTFGTPLPDSVSPGNYSVNKASQALTGALKTAVPGYSDALAVSGDYLSSKAAFDLGNKAILDRNMDANDFAKAFGKLSSAEQTALKGGVANRLYSLSQNSALKPSQYLTPAARQKLSVALGPNAAQDFISSLGDEAALRAFETRAVPAAGSQTAPLAQAMKEQDAFGSNPVTDALGNVAQYGLKGTVTRTSAGILKNIGSRIRTTGLDEAARNQAGRLLLMPPDQLAAFLRNASVQPANNQFATSGAALPIASAATRLLLAH